MTVRSAGVVGLSQSEELLFLFVVLPFIVAAGVLWFVSWRWKDVPTVRTSEVLASGDVAAAEVLSVRPLGGLFDPRPMVRLGLRVTVGDEAPFELEITQSIPRLALRDLRAGDHVEARVTPDRSTAAVVLGPPSA